MFTNKYFFMAAIQQKSPLNQFKLNKKVIVKFACDTGKKFMQTTLTTDTTNPTGTMNSQSLL